MLLPQSSTQLFKENTTYYIYVCTLHQYQLLPNPCRIKSLDKNVITQSWPFKEKTTYYIHVSTLHQYQVLLIPHRKKSLDKNALTQSWPFNKDSQFSSYLSLSLFWKPNLYTNPTTKEKEKESSYKYPLYTMKKMSWLTVGILFNV